MLVINELELTKWESSPALTGVPPTIDMDGIEVPVDQ